MILSELLLKDNLKDLKLLTKEVNLDRKIVSADISETPDIVNFIKPNSMLITTGMIFEKNPQGMREWIKQLSDLPIACVVIKLGRFINNIDDDIIYLCNKLDFPLFTMPQEETLGTLCQNVLAHLWNKESKELNSILYAQRKLSDLMIAGTSLEKLSDSLGDILKQDVLILTTFFENICETKRYNTHISTHITALIPEIQKMEDKKPRQFSIRIAPQRMLYITAFPITLADNYFYSLILASENAMTKKSNLFIIEQAASILFLKLYEDRMTGEKALMEKNKFFTEIAEKNLTRDETQDILNKYQINELNYYQTVIVGIDNIETDETGLYYEFLMYLQKLIKPFLTGVCLFLSAKKDSLIMLIFKQNDTLYEKLGTLQRTLLKENKLPCSFAIGYAVNSPYFIDFSLIRAQEVYKKYRKTENQLFIRLYSASQLEDLFHDIPSNHKKQFTKSVLKDLASPKDQLHEELLHTLNIYLECQCDATKAAKQLFVHRNTVAYRIEKIEEILDYKVSDSTHSLELRIALFFSNAY